MIKRQLSKGAILLTQLFDLPSVDPSGRRREHERTIVILSPHKTNTRFSHRVHTLFELWTGLKGWWDGRCAGWRLVLLQAVAVHLDAPEAGG